MHTGADLGRGLAVRILKDAGFSVEDYLRLNESAIRQRFPSSARFSRPPRQLVLDAAVGRGSTATRPLDRDAE
jgi:hypothetical protein